MLQIPYDYENEQYYGPEAELLYEELERSAYDEEKDLVQKRYEKVKEIKSMCRFCFTGGKDTPCVPTNKLYSCSVDPVEMMVLIGINQEYIEPFNDIVCENCFDRFVDFCNYRKRCQLAQKEIIQFMQDMDEKIANVQKAKQYQEPPTNWFKIEVQEQEQDVSFQDFFESDKEEERDDAREHFDDSFPKDDISFGCEPVQDEQPTEFGHFPEVSIKMEPTDVDSEPEEATIKEKKRKRSSSGAQAEATSSKKRKTEKKRNTSNIPTSLPAGQEKPNTSKIESSFKKKHKKDFGAPKILTSLPIKQEPQNVIEPGFEYFKKTPVNRRTMTYECFFCQKKFIGEVTFKAHICEVTRKKCEVDGCDLYFSKQGGYNYHIQRKHGLPKTSRHSCPVCRTNFQMSAMQFDEHCRKCTEENQYKEQPIRCDKCKKVFQTLQLYTAHTIFHAQEDIKKVNPTGEDKTGRSTVNHMCDLCGRTFKNNFWLKRHQDDVHLLDFDGNMFFCDLCPIAKPTKRLLYNHMRTTHIIKWHACEICAKVLKNREAWRKHLLVHGDRNHFCSHCPDREGFVSKAALKKHVIRHHGGAEPVRKFICNVPNCGAAFSRDDQLTRHRVAIHQIYSNYDENTTKYYVEAKNDTF